MEAGLMDCAPIWTDLKTFPWSDFRDRWTSSLVATHANHSLQQESDSEPKTHDTSGRLSQPELLQCDQVSVSLKTSRDISALGYPTCCKTWQDWVTERRGEYSSASEVGAPHQRKRVFILAYRNEPGWEARWHNAISSQGRQPHELAACGGDQRGAEELADSIMRGMSRSRNELGDIGEAGQGRTHLEANSHIAWPSRPGEPQHEWEPPRVVKPSLGGDPARDSGGVDYAELCISCDNRADELRLLGNGVVPATAERAFRILMQELVG
jgi:hypothetical protein